MTASIAIVGGTGKEGRGLGARWARAHRDVVLGSRDPDRALAAAAELTELSGTPVAGATNAEAVSRADIAVLATPFDGLAATLGPLADALRGKLVVSAVIPLEVVDGVFRVRDVAEGSAAELVAATLPGSRVGAAFHNISYRRLLDLDHQMDEDVPVAADDDGDRETILELCTDLGARGVAVGPLGLSRYLEGFTAVLLSVNKLHRTQSGIRFTGLR